MFKANKGEGLDFGLREQLETHAPAALQLLEKHDAVVTAVGVDDDPRNEKEVVLFIEAHDLGGMAHIVAKQCALVMSEGMFGEGLGFYLTDSVVVPRHDGETLIIVTVSEVAPS